MADFSIELGDVFLLDTGASKPHWYIAIAPFSPEEFIFVNVSTWYEGSKSNDSTCVLYPSTETPRFLKHKSFIAYQHARLFTASQLQQFIIPDSKIPYDRLNASLLRQIQEKSLQARKLKKKYINTLRSYLNPPNTETI